MANQDFARGLWPVGHLTGGQIRSHPYTLTTGDIIRRGELVKVMAGGTVEDAAGGDGIIVLGVSADYVDDSASAGGLIVNVYDDPNIIFGIQAVTGDTPALIGVFSIADTITCAKSGTDGIDQISDTELDYDGGNAQMLIIGKVGTVGNDWGEHCDLLVVFNEHYMKGMTAAAASAGV